MRIMSRRQREGGGGLLKQLLALGGLTFFKDYVNNGGTLNAGYSKGSPTATFTRDDTGKIATYADSNGVIQTATTNTPRYQGGYYDDTGFHAKKGLMIEAARTNLSTYSSIYENAAWTKTNVSVSDGISSSPDGGYNGSLLYSTSDNGTVLHAAATGRAYSVFLKGVNSVQFDGTNDNVTVVRDAKFESVPFTWHFRIKPTIIPLEGGGDRYILSKFIEDPAGDQYYLLIESADGYVGKLGFGINHATGDASATHSDTVLVANQVYDVTIVVGDDGSQYTQELYVDGVLEDSGVFPYSNPMKDGIGRLFFSKATADFAGRMYDIKFWNRALNATEVATVAAGGTASGLSSHWDSSDGAGTTLTDIVGGNNGTLNSGAAFHVTGTVSVTGDGTNYTEAAVVASGWRRFSDVRASASQAFGIKIATSGDEVIAFGSQYENNPYPSSLMPATTATMGRSAELLLYAVDSDKNRTKATETIAIKFAPESTFANDSVRRYLHETQTKLRRSYKFDTATALTNNPNVSDFAAVQAQASVTIPQANTSYVNVDVFQTATPQANIYMGGTSEGVSATNTWDGTIAWGTSFAVGSQVSGANQLNGVIQSIAIFSDPKDSTAVTAITNAMNS